MKTKKGKAGFIILVLFSQFIILELFERFYYRFEDIYTMYTEDIEEPKEQGYPQDLVHNCSEPPIPSPNDPFYQEDEFKFRTWGINYSNKCGKRFLFVGSRSLGWGTGVRNHQTFASTFYKKIRDLRPDSNFEVINGNLAGYALKFTFNLLKDVFFSKIKPDIVVLGLYPTAGTNYESLNGDTVEERVFGLGAEKSQRNGISISYNGMPIVSKIRHSNTWYELYSRSFLMGKLLAHLDIKMKEAIDVFFSSSNENKIEASPDPVGYVRDLYEFLRNRNIPLVVAKLPKYGGHEEQAARIISHIEEMCRTLKIPYLDVALLAPESTLTYVADGHYSIDSNKKVGGIIADWADKILDDNFRLREPEVISKLERIDGSGRIDLSKIQNNANLKVEVTGDGGRNTGGDKLAPVSGSVHWGVVKSSGYWGGFANSTYTIDLGGAYWIDSISVTGVAPHAGTPSYIVKLWNGKDFVDTNPISKFEGNPGATTVFHIKKTVTNKVKIIFDKGSPGNNFVYLKNVSVYGDSADSREALFFEMSGKPTDVAKIEHNPKLKVEVTGDNSANTGGRQNNPVSKGSGYWSGFANSTYAIDLGGAYWIDSISVTGVAPHAGAPSYIVKLSNGKDFVDTDPISKFEGNPGATTVFHIKKTVTNKIKIIFDKGSPKTNFVYLGNVAVMGAPANSAEIADLK